MSQGPVSFLPSDFSGDEGIKIYLEDIGAWPSSAFLAPETNSHDHRQIMQLKLPAEVYAEVAQIVSDHQFPYRSVQQFIRNAINVHIARLRYAKPAKNTYLREIIALQHRFAQEELKRESQRTLAGIQDSVDWYLQLGTDDSIRQLRRFLSDTRSKMISITDDDGEDGFWKKWQLQQFDSLYGSWLGLGSSSSLVPGTDGKDKD